MMHWYNYLFAVLAVLGWMLALTGMYLNAKREAPAAVLYGIVLLVLHSGVFYWNVYG